MSYLAKMADGLDDVTRACFALGANHGGSFADSSQRFAEISGTANKRHLEWLFVDVMLLVGGGQDLALIDEIHAQRFEDLGFDKMADADFCHHGNSNCGHDFSNSFWRGHSSNAAFGPDVGGHSLECHDRNSAGFLGYQRLLGSSNVHYHATLEHFGQTGLQSK